MTILKYEIKCDQCDKIIDAIKDTFLANERGDWCEECNHKYGAM